MANDKQELEMAQLVKMQKHRDAWRGYAYGTRQKPQDFLDGNMVDRQPTLQESQAAELARVRGLLQRAEEIAEQHQCDDICKIEGCGYKIADDISALAESSLGSHTKWPTVRNAREAREKVASLSSPPPKCECGTYPDVSEACDFCANKFFDGIEKDEKPAIEDADSGRRLGVDGANPRVPDGAISESVASPELLPTQLGREKCATCGQLIYSEDAEFVPICGCLRTQLDNAEGK